MEKPSNRINIDYHGEKRTQCVLCGAIRACHHDPDWDSLCFITFHEQDKLKGERLARNGTKR